MLRKILISAAFLAFPLASFAGDSGQTDSGRITGKEALSALVSGHTQYRDRSDGSSEIEYQHPDGTSAYVWESCVERGKWWTTETEICFFYPDSSLKGPHCFWVEQNEQGQLEFWWSGDPLAPVPTATTVKDVKGNVENLPLGVSGECLMS